MTHTLSRPARRRIFTEMHSILKQIAELRRKWESDDESEMIDSIDYMDGLQQLPINELLDKVEGRL